jgi:lauroyl/myristoyl acyltransferase
MSAAEIRRAMRLHFQRTRCDKLMYLIFDLLPRDEVVNRFEVVNRKIGEDALAQGNGLYIAMSHHGAHHVMGLMAALLGYKAAGVRDRKEGAMRRYVQSMYERRYPELRKARVLYADSFPRDIYRCFKENYVLISALDIARVRGARLKTANVQFFGQTHKFLTGTMEIALRQGTPILQGFIVSCPNFRYRLDLIELMTDDLKHKPHKELLPILMQRYADNIEHYVRKHPEAITKT